MVREASRAADELAAALDPAARTQGRGLTVSDEHAPQGVDLALEFVRFCYRRRPVAWPLIYDEMCAVAGHGLFRGLGYSELAERGISFCLAEMPRLCQLAQRVIAEEAVQVEPVAEPLTGMPALVLAPATA